PSDAASGFASPAAAARVVTSRDVPRGHAPARASGAMTREPSSVWEWFSRQAERAPERDFIFFEGTWLTYREVHDRAGTVAGGMAAAGVAKGDRVAFLASNSPDYFVAFLAVVRLGALFVPIIDGSTAPEVEYVLEHSGASYLVTDEAQIDQLGDQRQRLLAEL